MNPTRTILAVAAAATLSSTLAGTLAGCAGSNASRAMYDKRQTLSVDTLNASAQRLVADTVSNPRFGRFKASNEGKETGEVVVRLNRIENRTEGAGSDQNGNAPTAYQQELFDWLEQYFADNGVVFQGDRASLEAADKEDSDDFYDQSTGKVTTGGKEKSVLLMDLVVFSQERAGTKEWTLRAKFKDKERGVSLMSASSVPEEANKR